MARYNDLEFRVIMLIAERIITFNDLKSIDTEEFLKIEQMNRLINHPISTDE